MGHVLFIVLHLAAVLIAGVGWLMLTIPLHLIYGVVASRKPAQVAADTEAPSPLTHVRCPDCRELVRADAVKCKHCGVALKPVDPELLRKEATQQRRDNPSGELLLVASIALAIGALYLIFR